MPNQQILEGLKFALQRGESLNEAMLTFFNAGYPRHEIEESARALQFQIHESQQAQIKNKSSVSNPTQSSVQPTNPPTTSYQTAQPRTMPNEKYSTSSSVSPINKKVVLKQKIQEDKQKISDYDSKPKQNILKSKTFVIILLIILLMFIGILISLFFFKEQVIEFLDKLWG